MFKRFFEGIFKQFFEVFWPKAVEYVAEQGLNNVKNIKDFEHNLESLRDKMKLLSAKASDVEEQIKHAELSGRKKRKREVEEWLEQVKSIELEVHELGAQVESQGFIMRLLDGGKATQLYGDIMKLVEQRVDFGEPVLDARGSWGETLLINEMVGKAFNENLVRILKVLENRKVSRIGVYGMGGVGKTTLAKHIYNRLVQQSQGRVFWITVSQEFTITSLQDKIAHCLGVDLSDEDEEAIRAGMLNRFLSQMNNSVLILDDVWERIDMLKVGCTFSADFCRLIITTRSSKVCDQIDCQEMIKVAKLGKDEAWKLFNEILGKRIKLGPQVERIAKSMAEVCDGLPLGIITLAGSMKGETSIHMWKNALVELKDCVARGQDETGEVGEVFRVLKYSFDRLNINGGSESNGFNPIQLCFMYCSLFPEDYKINRDDLVEKFILEGLLGQRRGRSRRAQVEEGLSILDKLVNVCLLESCVDDDGEECVKMHDLVRVMTLMITKGKYLARSGDYSFQEITNVQEWTESLEKVSLMTSSIETIGDGISPNCPNLSTFLLRENAYLKVISDSFFSKMQGLCTLDLCGTSILKVLPDSVGDLKSLKSLLLENCYKLESVPYLGKLKALRKLNLSRTAIKDAPQGLEELLNLRFLSIDANGLKMLPSGVLLKLGHLQHLNLPFHIQVEIEEIENLKQLEEFGGGLKNVNDFNWFTRTRGVHDPCYRIGVNSNACRLGFAKQGDLGGKDNELTLSDCNLKDEKVLGKRIVYLTISRCEGLGKCFVDDLSRQFDNPVSLKKLRIWRCGVIEWILRSDGQASQISETLEEMGLFELDDLKGVVMERGKIPIGPSTSAPTQLHVFSSLKSLVIFKCNKMRKAGLPASGAPNLGCIEIRRCEEIEEIFEEDERRPASTLPGLKELYLEDLPKLRKVGFPACRIPKLEEIKIICCGKIQVIFKQDAASILTILPKLAKLYLHDLPRLRKVGLPASRVPNLELVDIRYCEEVEEIFDEGRDPVTTLPKLEKLWLYKLPRLKRVSKATIISNSIQIIRILSCPRLMNKLPVNFDDPVPPPSLKQIRVEREWWESLEWENTSIPLLLKDFIEFM